MHLHHADLRAYLDSQLSEPDHATAAAHLAGCETCQQQLDTLAGTARQVDQRLNVLAPRPGEAPALPKPEAAYATQRKGVLPMSPSVLTRKPLWAGLALVAAVAISLTFAPVRAWAGEFLGLFRVQKVEVLPVDFASLEGMGGENMSQQLEQLFADSITFKREPGEPVVVADAAEASQQAGFNVRLLGAAPGAPRLTVARGPAFEIVIDRERAQAVLNELGRTDLQLPASVDGATIAIDVPTAVMAEYGDCGPGASPADPSDPDGLASRRTCVTLGQLPSPDVSAPPDLDMPALAEIGLQVIGLSPAEAREFSQKIDWTTTLVVPVPRYAADFEDVSVDGVTGTLIYSVRNSTEAQPYALLWVKDDMTYVLNGFGRPAEALRLASSIQ